MSHWTFDNIPDQSGRTAVVTGSNTGIGFETARMLALKGAQVVLACRSADKGQAAVGRILAEAPSAQVSFLALDLADLERVAAFAQAFSERHERLDLLILNAGVMVPPASKTAQGFELQFGVNHLGHFALTGALLERVEASSGRVVVVSSTAAQFGKMRFEDLHFEQRYQAWPAYGQSKLANQLFVRELQKRLKSKGSSVLVTAAHPGWTATDLQRTSGLATFLNPVFAMKPPQGALPTLRAATDPAAGPGDYFGPDGMMQMRGHPVKVPMVKDAENSEHAARLWQLSEELTGVRYGL